MNGKRAASVTHVEYEILKHVTEKINLRELRSVMATDKVTEDRFDKGAANVVGLIQNMMSRHPMMASLILRVIVPSVKMMMTMMM